MTVHASDNFDFLQEYWAMAVRRKWLIAGSICLSLLVAWGLLLVLPKSFRSSTLILVEGQKIPERYVQGVVSGNVQERLSLIQQQVMSRTLLKSIIDEFHLYDGPETNDGQDLLIAEMRKSIKVETKGGGRVEAFSISFAHEDPALAMKITTRLASQFIEENLRLREQFVEGASEFLDQELESASVALQEREKKIGYFKQQHMGGLPGQIEANLRALDRLQAELASVEELVPKVNERLDVVDRAISTYDMSWVSSRVSLPRVKSESGSGQPVGGNPVQDKLRDLEQKLAILKSQYKDTYPDVVQLQLEIDRLRVSALESKAGPDDSQEKPGLAAEEKVSPRQGDTGGQRLASDPYMQGLLKQRNDIKAELALLKDRQHRLNTQIKEYEGRVERAPLREQELAVLTRDYENMQKNYASLLDKKLNARIAENLEKRQKGEQFRILDPANFPSSPEKPDPLKVLLAGLFVGCGLGVGSAYMLEQSVKVFRRVEEVERLLDLSILATIPDFNTAYQTNGGGEVSLPSPRFGERSGAKVEKQIPSFTAESRAVAAQTQKAKQVRSWIGKPYGVIPGKGHSATEAMKFELNLVSKWRPNSLVAEQFRVAATRLVLGARGQKSTVVVVTSSLKGEGKSATASNLSYVLGQDLGKSTVLVDCDFKCPMLHLYYGVPAQPGLSEVILEGAQLDTCLHRPGEASPYILPTGKALQRPVDLTHIPDVRKILEELKEKFEFIVVDAPPILPLADMNLLSEMADMLVVVIRTGLTPQDIVRRAMKALRPTSRVGVILTAYGHEGLSKYITEYYSPSVALGRK